MFILGEWNTLWEWELLQSIDFEWFKIWTLSLSSLNFSVKDFKIQEKVENNNYRNPFADWLSPISYYLRGWTITFNLTIKGATKQELMQKIDDLRSELFEENQVFYFEINWVKRKVIVKCVWNPLNFNNYNITFLKTSITLEYDDFFLNLSKSNVVFTNKTANFSANIDNEWTQRSELEIYYVFAAWTNLTQVEIVDWENVFSVDETFIEWDVLKIDWLAKKVTKNWVVVDFGWELLWIENEWTTLEFNFTWTVACDIFILNDVKYR